MDEIILAIIKKAKVISVRELQIKTGFSESDIKDALYRLALKGKIDFAIGTDTHKSVCSKCPLNKICHLNHKGGVKIGID